MLPPLLYRFARDSAASVRASLLQQLPYLIYKRPDLGWQLLAAIFQEPQTQLWSHAERCFYYQYSHHFELVKPFLDRLFQEGLKEAGETWGRITTLATLAGHNTQEQLLDILKRTNTKVRKGAAQVFGANIDRSEHSAMCNTGLLVILNHDDLTDDIIQAVGNCFRKETNCGFVQNGLALTFIDKVSTAGKRSSLFNFFEWLAYEARHDPRSALDLTEKLADKLEEQENLRHLWHTKPLVPALIEILREADETGDQGMIRRAINLQDRFLKLDMGGMEALLDRIGNN